MSEQNTERRRFQRFVMDRPVTLVVGGDSHPASLVDISLKGLLLQLDDDWRPESGSELIAHVSLDDGDEYPIEMSGKVTHLKADRLGLFNNEMDLDSAARLRRLVELNLANSELLERELAHLLEANAG